MFIDEKWPVSTSTSSPPQADAYYELRRWSAIAADQGSVDEVPLSTVWSELTSGGARIADSFLTDQRCYLILNRVEQEASAERRPCARRVRILERILLEGNQKGVAIDLGLAPSTVALLTKQCLRSLGLACTPSRVPPQLVMAAHQAHGVRGRDPARSSVLRDGETAYRVVSVARPDLRLSSLLPPAQFLVTRLLVEGKSHAEIAARRRTTLRTVANQLAATFHRLGVSGRLDLIGQLAHG